MNSQPHDSVPGLNPETAAGAAEILDGRLVALLDMQLTLKHVHWNVVGPSFISVHEMLDDHVGPVREMTDEIAERIRTLGGVPVGTPAAIVSRRTWDDYDLQRESVYVHLKKLDEVYSGIIADHRRAIEQLSDLDPVSEGVVVDQTARLEQFQWFVRSFFERSGASDEHGHVGPAARAADSRDAEAHAGADRAPSDRERRDAEKGAEDVDLDQTATHYKEMTSVGAQVKGEGAI